MQKGVILGCRNRSNAGMDTVTLNHDIHPRFIFEFLTVRWYGTSFTLYKVVFLKLGLPNSRPKCRLPCSLGISKATMSFQELEKYLSILEDKNLANYFYASRRKTSLRNSSEPCWQAFPPNEQVKEVSHNSYKSD
jgi:hypothetical protein